MSECSVGGCTRKYNAKGFCAMHYHRWRRYGDVNKVKIHKNIGGKCSIEGCGQTPRRRSLCNMHYRRIAVNGSAGPGYRLKSNHVLGKRTDSSGYVILRNFKNHPNAQKNGRLAEHVKVMSDFIGRPLRKGETVHHKNGIRDDNRVENLELWVSRHPPGQRLDDVRKFVSDFVREYGIEMEMPF